MNLKKLAVLTLLLSGIGFTGATAAHAEIFIDCVAGYEAVYSDDHESGECVPIKDATAPDDSVNGCWVTEDGTDVCARGGVVQEPMPTSVDETPLPISSDCADPEAPCLFSDSPCTDPEACPEIMESTGMLDGDVNLKAYNSMGQRDNSDYLIALGLITALLGAIAIVLSRREFGKK